MTRQTETFLEGVSVSERAVCLSRWLHTFIHDRENTAPQHRASTFRRSAGSDVHVIVSRCGCDAPRRRCDRQDEHERGDRVLRGRAVALQPHAVVDGRGFETTEYGVQRLARPPKTTDRDNARPVRPCAAARHPV